MAAYLSPIGNDQTIDSNGNPLVGGFWEVFLAGTTTPVTTYTSNTGLTPQAASIVLDASGRTANPIWITGGVPVKFRLSSAASVVLLTVDNVSGINDPSNIGAVSEWVQYGAAPTYVSATSFSVTGDQTNTFQIGRRLKSVNTGGTRYSTITNSVYGAVTTVTVTNDSGTLDSGLSIVSYGLLAAINPSVPATYVKTGLATASGLTMSTARMLGRTTALTGAIEELTAAQVSAFAAAASDTAQGVVELLTSAEAQAGTDTTRAMTATAMKAAQIQLATAVTLTTQTSVDFTSIPSWVNRVTVTVSGMSTNGTSTPIIQLGDSGGFETSGYVSAGDDSATIVSATTGFVVSVSVAGTHSHYGAIQLNRHSANTWIANGDITQDRAGSVVNVSVSGGKTLSATLTQVRLTTVGGTDQFDAGTVNISYE